MHLAFTSNISMPYGCLLYTKRKQSQAIISGLTKYVHKGQAILRKVKNGLKNKDKINLLDPP